MKPFEVKLDYRGGRPWCTVKFELGHNEIGDADEPEFQLAGDLAELFTEVGLETPKPVPVMRADHQVAQKLHAVSGAGSERARDLVDLQLLDKREVLDLGQVAATCVRLFDYRQQHSWPPLVVAGDHWDTLYAESAEGWMCFRRSKRRSSGSTTSCIASLRSDDLRRSGVIAGSAL